MEVLGRFNFIHLIVSFDLSTNDQILLYSIRMPASGVKPYDENEIHAENYYCEISSDLRSQSRRNRDQMNECRLISASLVLGHGVEQKHRKELNMALKDVQLMQ